MNYCVNCKHLVDTIHKLCANPGNGINLVTGEPVMKSAGKMRDDSVTCGPTGKWFYAKVIPWYGLFK